MSKKVKKVWWTEEEKNKIRCSDLNDWNPVITPKSIRLNVKDKKKWPKIYVKSIETFSYKMQQRLEAAHSGELKAILDFCKGAVYKIVDYVDMDTDKVVTDISEAIESMPQSWLLEIMSGTATGGVTKEEITGVKP